MLNPNLTSREEELLKLVRQWQSLEIDKPVNTLWLMKNLCIEKPRLSGIKKQLIKKGFFIDRWGEFILTDYAKYYLDGLDDNNYYHGNNSTPFIGEVRAGRTKQDEIYIDFQGNLDINNTLIFPENIGYMRVVGESMKEEGINDGDYVLIQKFGHEWPMQKELIIAYYLAPGDESNFETSDISDELLEGPTIKYYTERPGAIRPYCLGWKKRNNINPYSIETKYIKPIARVLACFRDLTGRNPHSPSYFADRIASRFGHSDPYD